MGKFILFFILAMFTTNGFWYINTATNTSDFIDVLLCFSCIGLVVMIAEFIVNNWGD